MKRQRSASPQAGRMSAPPTSTESILLDQIKEAAKGSRATFACGRTKKSSRPVRILFQGNSTSTPQTWKVLELPSREANYGALDDLISACTIATSGINPSDISPDARETSTYKQARELDAAHFDITLNLAEMGILTQIKTLMAPKAADLRAELCKLSIHKQGDSSETQVDPPHIKNLVGSLVIALPSLHKGGQLTVMHRTRHQVFDWSLDSLPDEPMMQWAAFSSKCKHEVRRLDSGVRITVTNNLMAVPIAPLPEMSLKDVNPVSLAPHNVMQKALADPTFLEHGGTLAFACQHAYPHESYTFMDTPVYSQFKGADACIVAVALNLGWKVEFGTHYEGVEPPLNHESDDAADEQYYEDEAGPEPVPNQAGKTFYFGAPYSMDWKTPLQFEDCDQWVSDWKAIKDKVGAYRNVIWCHDIDKCTNYGELGQVYSLDIGGCRGPGSHDICYLNSHGVILVHVPPATRRR